MMAIDRVRNILKEDIQGLTGEQANMIAERIARELGLESLCILDFSAQSSSGVGKPFVLKRSLVEFIRSRQLTGVSFAELLDRLKSDNNFEFSGALIKELKDNKGEYIKLLEHCNIVSAV